MKIKNYWLVITIFVIVFGGIFLFDALGMWQTESSKEVSVISEGEFAGQGDPEDIRGSYSFDDVNANFNISPSILAKAFNIASNDPGSIKAKNLEEIYTDLGDGVEIGTGAVKQFVATFNGLPYEGDDYILSSTISVLKEHDKWSDELENKFSGFVIEVDENNKKTFDAVEITEDTSQGEESSDHVEEIGIKGKTTVSDAISYGITLDKIEEVLGVKVSNENMLIRDICEQNGLSFSSIKEQLSLLLEEND